VQNVIVSVDLEPNQLSFSSGGRIARPDGVDTTADETQTRRDSATDSLRIEKASVGHNGHDEAWQALGYLIIVFVICSGP